MKLNYKRTFLVGLAFMSICAFWQLYDGIIPLILDDTYGLSNAVSGVIMGADNFCALFLLPVFGALSDRKGRRMPFIIIGTAIAALIMIILPIAVNGYDADRPALSLIIFFAILASLLISMSIYRSPAVALMADVTPKPLRSQGNAVINLMGAFGGVMTLAAVKFAVIYDKNGNANYFYLFLIIAIFMIAAITVLVLTINEKRLVDDMRKINYGVSENDDQGKHENSDGRERLPRPVLKSLILILASIGLWFFGYNAVTTFFTKYATANWSGGLSNASTCLMVATVVAVASYIPIGILSAKIGRKRVICLGLSTAAAAFLAAAFFAREFSIYLYIIFAFAGFAQAAVTVNTFPMVWEISKLGNIGKYTGLYYTVSMAAQTITPLFVGIFLDKIGYDSLFPYSFIFIVLAIIPISFAKHGDNKPIQPKNKLEVFDVSD